MKPKNIEEQIWGNLETLVYWRIWNNYNYREDKSINKVVSNIKEPIEISQHIYSEIVSLIKWQ